MITSPVSVLFSAYPILGEIASQPPELIDIIKGASTRITTAMNKGKIDEIDEGYDSELDTIGQRVVDFWAVITFDKIDLHLTVTVTINNSRNMVSECALQCYIKVLEQQQHRWFDTFKNHAEFFFSNDGYGKDYVVIGLCRPIGFKKELEAFLDGHSSKTSAEIKQMFENFLNREPFGLPSNLKPDLEAILNDFLTCVENTSPIIKHTDNP